jgi:hypothetical protein
MYSQGAQARYPRRRWPEQQVLHQERDRTTVVVDAEDATAV